MSAIRTALARSLSIDERVAAGWTGSVDATHLEQARRRVAEWRAQKPFAEGDSFARRLASIGLDEESLIRLLAAPPEELLTRCPAVLRVAEEIEIAYRERVSAGIAHRVAGGPPLQGFLAGLDPLLARGVDRLQRGIDALALRIDPLPFDPAVVAGLLLPDLLQRIVVLSTRALVLELNIARLQGELAGETPHERFLHFESLLATPERALRILIDQPVLARQIVEVIDQWTANSLELLTQLAEDRDTVAATFAGGVLPPLSAISGGAGDTHRGGRAVRILTFGDRKIVHKPRSLTIDVRFQELLEWLDARGSHPPFRALRVLDRGHYGWAEFVETAPCGSEEEVRRFYERQGGLLALLYALDAVDFHQENLIAAGEHPVLIDLESLFHHRPSTPAADDHGLGRVQSVMSESVMRIGMLPQRMWADGDAEGVDVSGLGGRDGQLTPFPVPAFEEQSTDRMRIVRKRCAVETSNNRPSLEGHAVTVENHAADLARGFAAIYRLLARERSELLAPGGLLERFDGVEVRAIRRPTRTYARLLDEAQHPELLGDALDRDLLFDRLWNPFPLLPAIVEAELRDLRRGDVPFFTSRIGSRDLYTADGAPIGGVCERASSEVVRDRLATMGEDDLARQLWFISASMESLSVSVHATSRPRVELPALPPGSVAGEARLLAAVRDVADRLEQLAIRTGGCVNWIGISLAGQKNWTMLPLVHDLYNGTLGVALFLAYAGEIAGEPRYTALARTTLDDARRSVEEVGEAVKGANGPRSIQSIGGFSGPGSLVHAFAHAARLWDDPRFARAGEELVELMAPLVERDETFDVIGGSAGCILNLLAHGSDRALALAARCGDRLLNEAIPLGSALAWPTRLGSQPLTGFSHGAAGIAVALLDLAAATGERRYRDAALRAIDYERSLYSPERGNWPDFRLEHAGGAAQPSFAITWCHGAPGIGLARVRALRHVDDPLIRGEIAAAVHTTLGHGWGNSHSLCHGDLGNLELLLEAAVQLGDERLRAETDRKAAAILESIEQSGWICGTPGGTETPGLLTGLAGIGYGLLRLAAPARVPSVLSLEAPVHDFATTTRRR